MDLIFCLKFMGCGCDDEYDYSDIITVVNQEKSNIWGLNSDPLIKEQLNELQALINNSKIDEVDYDNAQEKIEEAADLCTWFSDRHTLEVKKNGEYYSCDFDNLPVYKNHYSEVEYFNVWYKLLLDILELLKSWNLDVSEFEETMKEYEEVK